MGTFVGWGDGANVGFTVGDTVSPTLVGANEGDSVGIVDG